jgi:predicted dehydrogenase
VIQRWLGDITGVFARGKVVHPIRDGYEVIIPDVLNVLCSFASGAEGVLEFSGVNAAATGDRLEIYGDEGKLTYDFTNDDIRLAAGGEDEETVEIPKDLAREWTVEDDFLSAVRSGGRMRPRPDFEEGVRYMRVVQAVADSRAENAFVRIKG